MAAFLECIHQLQTELGPDARQEDGTAQQKVADIIADAILALPNPVGEKVREKIFKHYKSGTASELLCAHPGDDKRAGLGWQDILGRQQEWITSPERFFDEPKPLNVALYLKAWSVRGKYGLLAAIKFRLIAGELHRCRTTWGARASKFREAVREAAYARTKTGNRFEAELHNKDFSEWNSYGRTSVYLSENFEPGTIIALAETLDSTYQKASTGDRAGENELFRDACSQAVREKARQFAQLEIALRGYLSNLCEKFKSVLYEEGPTFTAPTQAEERVTPDHMLVEAPLGTLLPGTGSHHPASLRPASVAKHVTGDVVCSDDSTNTTMPYSSQLFDSHASMDVCYEDSQRPSKRPHPNSYQLPTSTFMHNRSFEGSGSLTADLTQIQAPSHGENPAASSCAPDLFSSMNMTAVWSYPQGCPQDTHVSI